LPADEYSGLSPLAEFDFNILGMVAKPEGVVGDAAAPTPAS
jgi:hypothetical protein